MASKTEFPFMDWEMVRLNGGPPCFAIGVDGDPNRFCARAERWEGHGSSVGHEYVSLPAFAQQAVERERAGIAARLRKVHHETWACSADECPTCDFIITELEGQTSQDSE